MPVHGLRDDLDFRSDNVASVSPAILEALMEAGRVGAPAYGADTWSLALERRLGDLFQAEVAVFPVATGTAANALALSALCPPWGVIYCHRLAHIEEDECGAPALFTGGAKLELLDGADGRLEYNLLAAALAAAPVGVSHRMQPAAVSLSQVSECGTLYRPDEIAAIAALCRRHGLHLHMDGARFANAVARLGCTPAALANLAGVDVLSFGATKNGAFAAEALVFFRPDLAADFRYRRKRAGHLLSKQRFLAAQLLAYLDDNLWLANAAHANDMASRLAAGIAALPGARLLYPVEANEVFVTLPEGTAARLEAAGVGFYRWGGEDRDTIRLVAAFDTAPAAVDRLVALLAGSLDERGNSA